MSNKAEKKEKKSLDIQLLGRIFRLGYPYKKQLWTGIILTVILAALAPLRPWLIQNTIDKDVSTGDYLGLFNTIALLVGILVIQTLFMFWQTYVTNWLGQSVIKDLRLTVYRYITKLKLRYYDKTPVGTMVTRSISDIETISEIFAQGVITISGDILQLLAIIGVMFYMDWQLSLVVLSTFPLLMLASYWFKEAVKKSFQDVRTNVSRLNSFVQEHITGMQIVQIFNREKIEFDRFKAINKEHRDANIRGVFYYAVFFPVIEIITAVSTGLLVWWGVRQAITAEIIVDTSVTLGKITAFILFINMFFRPIRQIADRFNTIQMGMVAAERIFKLIDDETDVEVSGTYKPERVKGEIEFKNVWFAYKEEEYVLKDISFKLQAGDTMALVGATGAGKSSIINLITKFYDIQKGTISVDGVNVDEYDLTALRDQVAVVLQDVFLFSGSIEDNINLYNSKITREQMLEAARLVGAESFIKKLPGGFDYNVMERGSSLSVGQRQLISFIRALAFDPKILILDEATSSVDSELEDLIQNAIKVLMQGRTSIVIAHRLSTIQNANEIMVLDKGQIMERGTHQELLAKEGFYQKLHDYQLADI